MPKRVIYDRWLFLTTALLVLGGLFMVGSASNYFAMEFGKSPSALWWRHAIHLVVGGAALVLMLQIPYPRLANGPAIFVLLALCAIGLIAVRAMPEVGGSQRWILIGPFRLQPSEFAKLGSVLFMAWYLSRERRSAHDAPSRANVAGSGGRGAVRVQPGCVPDGASGTVS